MLKKILLFVIALGGIVYLMASQSGLLRSGEEVVLQPLDGHSLNLIRQSGSNANFDIEMSNRGKVYYSAQDQVDDIYLVFHDNVQPGDRIKIHVNSGTFQYRIAPVKALPTMVKKALYKKALQEKKRTHPKVKKRKQKKRVKKIAPKQELIVGEFVEESKPKSQPLIQQPEEPKTLSSTQMQPAKTHHTKPLSDSFYSNFTHIFKNLIKSFSMTPSAKSNEKKEQTQEKKSEPHSISAPAPKPQPKKETVDPAAMAQEATIIRRDFSKLPTEIKLFDDKKIEEESAIKPPVFKEFKPSKEEKKSASQKIVPTTPKLQTNPIASTPQPTTQKSTTPPTSKPITIPAPTQIATKPLPVYVPSPVEVPKPIIPNKQEPTPSYEAPQPSETINTDYKEGYEDLNPPKEEEKPSEGRIQKTGNKIVITKVIDKKSHYPQPKEEEDIFAGRVLGKMDDRVLGGGYNPDNEVGRLSMRVTQNNKPVSAWIEVFKNGTKDRVKTFYSMRGHKMNTIKLPAGIYMVRATYRTRDGKLQKTLKNIHLKEGGDITRHISFQDGKIKVVATRGGKPLYVKVSVYRTDNHQRINYEFSDRSSGVATVTVPTGTYEVEVTEHGNKKVLPDVHVGASQTEKLSVEF